VSGVLLVPWSGVLIEQLHGQANKRSFSSSWVGLDVLKAVCCLCRPRSAAGFADGGPVRIVQALIRLRDEDLRDGVVAVVQVKPRFRW
jgi:hypothetical protein